MALAIAKGLSDSLKYHRLTEIKVNLIREHLTYAMSINAYSSQKLENPELDHKEK